jgi:hypothetical protein
MWGTGAGAAVCVGEFFLTCANGCSLRLFALWGNRTGGNAARLAPKPRVGQTAFLPFKAFLIKL